MFPLRITICFQQAALVFAQSLSVAFLRRPDGSIEPNISLSGPMQEVQGVINDLHKLSSCNKVATAHLLESCSSLPDPLDPRSADMILDKPKRIYVARLALCEISEAPGAKWPRGCHGLDLARRNDVISEENIDHCVNDLYFASTSNMWTSYSSAKKHAAGICQSVRSGIEQDEHLRTFQTLFNATAMVSQELSDSKQQLTVIRDAFSLLRLGLFEFLTDVRTQYDELIASGRKDWQEVEIHTQSVTAGLENALLQLQQVSDKLARHEIQAQRMSAEARDIRSAELVRLKEDSEAAQAHIIFTVQIALDGIAQVSSRTTKYLETAGGLSSELTTTLADHLLRLDDAAKAVQDFSVEVTNLRTSLAETRAEQESSLLDFQVSLNDTKDFLLGVTPFSHILATVQFPNRFFKVDLPLLTSVLLFTFAVLYGRFGVPYVASLAAATSVSIVVRHLVVNWDYSVMPRIAQVTVPERIIWVFSISAIILITSYPRWTTPAFFLQIFRHGETTGSSTSNHAETQSRQWTL